MVFRKIVLAVIALLLTGMIPAVAAMSCHDMPCCHPQGVAFTNAKAACCSPSRCIDEAKAVKNSTAQQHHLQVVWLDHFEPLIVIVPAHLPSRVDIPSPPSTSERLSTLSILLI